MQLTFNRLLETISTRKRENKRDNLIYYWTKYQPLKSDVLKKSELDFFTTMVGNILNEKKTVKFMVKKGSSCHHFHHVFRHTPDGLIIFAICLCHKY
jgi:hypothetical protein